MKNFKLLFGKEKRKCYIFPTILVDAEYRGLCYVKALWLKFRVGFRFMYKY